MNRFRGEKILFDPRGAQLGGWLEIVGPPENPQTVGKLGSSPGSLSRWAGLVGRQLGIVTTVLRLRGESLLVGEPLVTR